MERDHHKINMLNMGMSNRSFKQNYGMCARMGMYVKFCSKLSKWSDVCEGANNGKRG